MKKETNEFKTIDEYIRLFPENIQNVLKEIRKAVKEEAPEAQEKISYQMPAFYQNGNLVYFAAFTKHIGFFPTSSGVSAFEKELSKYKHARGSVQFPLDGPMPLELIRKIVRFRVKENTGRKK